MDKISGLSDELLVKVLLFLPTKVAVSTSVLSKRWERLWMWLPKLEFESSYGKPECERLWCFLDRNLPLHKAPVIESLRLNLSSVQFKPEDVKLWIVIAVFRHISELEISYYYSDRNILPSSLYTCESLVVLKLKGRILLDVPRMVCLPSLKTLQLREMVHSVEGSLQRLLSICPILEDLLVEFHSAMRKFTIIHPSLQSLSLYIPIELDGFVINTPSLRYFKLEYESLKNHSCLIENMPKLMEAYVDVNIGFSNIKRLIRSITSVKSLTLCVKYYGSKPLCHEGIVFNHLEYLKLCACLELNNQVRFLKHCPNLSEVNFFVIDEHNCEDNSPWKEPKTVPECILSKLQILKWSNYFGHEDERNLAVYILRNARGLKKDGNILA